MVVKQYAIQLLGMCCMNMSLKFNTQYAITVDQKNYNR